MPPRARTLPEPTSSSSSSSGGSGSSSSISLRARTLPEPLLEPQASIHQASIHTLTLLSHASYSSYSPCLGQVPLFVRLRCPVGMNTGQQAYVISRRGAARAREALALTVD